MHTFIKISLLLLVLLSACNLSAPDPTVLPEPPTASITDTPSPDSNSTECGFVWAREPLPDLSEEFDEALKVELPQASGYAEAYGENCLNNQGEVVRFLAMETDFYVTLEVENLEDKQALGKLAEQVLSVVAQFPVGSTPGPQAGYVGIVFQGSGNELRLWFPRRDAEAALGSGLRGIALFDALETK